MSNTIIIEEPHQVVESQEVRDFRLMKLAYQYAIINSTDPSTQNGAVLIDDVSTDPLVYSANHFPKGVKETPERWERPLKYSYVEHAERNAIFNAAKQGIATKGLVMYCPWHSCADCGRAIIQAGIKEVIGHQFVDTHERAQWYESIKVSIGMLEEAGVKCRWITGKVGIEGLRFNGKLVNR